MDCEGIQRNLEDFQKSSEGILGILREFEPQLCSSSTRNCDTSNSRELREMGAIP